MTKDPMALTEHPDLAFDPETDSLISLSDALLCVSCSSIYHIRRKSKRCPCGSDSAVLLGAALEVRGYVPGDQARVNFRGSVPLWEVRR